MIVVGQQSSGKSALIEALIGFQFNQASSPKSDIHRCVIYEKGWWRDKDKASGSFTNEVQPELCRANVFSGGRGRPQRTAAQSGSNSGEISMFVSILVVLDVTLFDIRHTSSQKTSVLNGIQTAHSTRRRSTSASSTSTRPQCCSSTLPVSFWRRS